MSTVDEIIVAIEQLNPTEPAELDRRLHREFDELDKQIANDFDGGKLNQLIENAKAEFKMGHTRDLP